MEIPLPYIQRECITIPECGIHMYVISISGNHKEGGAEWWSPGSLDFQIVLVFPKGIRMIWRGQIHLNFRNPQGRRCCEIKRSNKPHLGSAYMCRVSDPFIRIAAIWLVGIPLIYSIVYHVYNSNYGYAVSLCDFRQLIITTLTHNIHRHNNYIDTLSHFVCDRCLGNYWVGYYMNNAMQDIAPPIALIHIFINIIIIIIYVVEASDFRWTISCLLIYIYRIIISRNLLYALLPRKSFYNYCMHCTFLFL